MEDIVMKDRVRILSALRETTMSRILLLTTGLAGGLSLSCAYREPAPPYTPRAIAASDAILDRMKEPFEPVPGARFEGAGVHHPRKHLKRRTEPIGRVSTTTSNGMVASRRAHQHAGFALDLREAHFSELWQRLREIAPETGKGWLLPSIRTWDDVLRAHKKRSHTEEYPVRHLSASLARFYAHRFSGLGLQSKLSFLWSGEEGEALSLVLHDVDRANVIRISVWVLVPTARAHVLVSVFTHAGERRYSNLPPEKLTRR